MTSFYSTLLIQMNGNLRNNYGSAGPGADIFTINANPRIQMNLGTGDYQANRIVTFGGGLINGQTLNIDLSALARPWFFGLASVKQILVYNTSVLTGYTFTIVGGAVDPWTMDGRVIEEVLAPTGLWCKSATLAGWPVTPTARTLTLTGTVPPSSSSSSSSSSSGGSVTPTLPTTVNYCVAIIGIQSQDLGSSSSAEMSSTGP